MSLPFELIHDEILCRVPVKYLLRCRCVSKEWCSIIDSPAFIKKHLNRSIVCNPDGDGLVITGNKYCVLDLDPYVDDAFDVIDIDDRDPLKTVLSGTYCVGAANCLVCFCKKEMNEFIVVNPLTRKYRNVPSLPVAEFFEMVEASPCGFGYDHVNDDYKVVTIGQFKQKNPLELLGIMVMVYSLKTCSWREIRKFPNDIGLVSLLGIFTSGVVHWFAKKFSQDLSHEIIVGFDLGLEKFVELPLPTVDGNFRVPSGGTLCIFDKCINCTDVWMINNYGAENPWYKAFSVEKQGALGSFKLVRPVAFSRSGKDVLLELDGTRLVWYNLESKVVKNVRIHGIPSKFWAQLYRESLLQLTENEQMQKPSEDNQGKQQKKRDDFLSKGFKLKL
ncbi:F-box protein CPR1-like isoform X2 [Apium graveolens]|uniref:F-box protein CPR1-like isoform X2 n=1 Tax=Apium graveolens TaxID=4045 RepID=UPI003D78B4AC